MKMLTSRFLSQADFCRATRWSTEPNNVANIWPGLWLNHVTIWPGLWPNTKTMTITWWRRPDPGDPGASSEAEHWCHRHRQPCHLPLPRPGEPRKYIIWQWYTVNCEDDDQMISMLCSIFQDCLALDDIEYSIHRNALHCGFHNWRRGLTETPWKRLPSTISFNLITISHKHGIKS